MNEDEDEEWRDIWIWEKWSKKEEETKRIKENRSTLINGSRLADGH
jgi:hypothetical protein